MAKAVNVTDLTRAAVTYDNVLRELPYFQLMETAKKLRINIQKVKGEHIIISKRRKADFIRPYKADLTFEDTAELLKFDEMKLKPERIFARLKENITAYEEKNVISNAGEPVNNKTKKHPLEFLILKDLVLSVSEDVLFNMFHAQRDTSVKSAATSFNGFFHTLDLLMTAERISAANKNIKTTGAFALAVDNPDTSFANYTRMVDFLKSAHPLLRRGEVLLYASEGPMSFVRDDFRKMVKAFDYPSMEQVVEKLRADANIPKLKVITDEVFGTGDRLTLTKPGNFDFGVGDETDKNYVQARNIDEDPNIVSYWIQASYDTRVQDVHQKVFLTNEQKNVGLNLAGDY